jgi:hypothetical protein
MQNKFTPLIDELFITQAMGGGGEKQNIETVISVRSLLSNLDSKLNDIGNKVDKQTGQQVDISAAIAEMIGAIKNLNDRASEAQLQVLMSILDKVQKCCPGQSIPTASSSNIPVVKVPIPEPQQQYVTVPIPPAAPKPVTFEYTYQPNTSYLQENCCPPGYIPMTPDQYRGIVKSKQECPPGYTAVPNFMNNPYMMNNPFNLNALTGIV